MPLDNILHSSIPRGIFDVHHCGKARRIDRCSASERERELRAHVEELPRVPHRHSRVERIDGKEEKSEKNVLRSLWILQHTWKIEEDSGIECSV